MNCIKNNNFLEITGAYEFKYLAATYNNVYEMTLEQQNMLRQKAERDALTGLLNRQSFEQLKDQLAASTEHLAFLLIDVDVFKSINDNYGHDMGDQALIKVANLLDENFRRGDYVMRIGGDEFAVLMGKMDPRNKQTISEKIDLINDRLIRRYTTQKKTEGAAIPFMTSCRRLPINNCIHGKLWNPQESGNYGRRSFRNYPICF